MPKQRKEQYKEGEAFMLHQYSQYVFYNWQLQKMDFSTSIKADDIIADNKHAPLSAKLYQEYGQLNKVIGLHDNALVYNAKALYF